MPCLIYTSRSPNEKKTSPVSIIGITSTSSVKALNLSNTFYIKNWSYYNNGNELKLPKLTLNDKIFFNRPTKEIVSSTTSVCISEHSISDGTWYNIKGARYGHDLVLELFNNYIWHHNVTLRTLELHTRRLHGKIKKKKEPPIKFIVDVRDGLTIGSVPKDQPNEAIVFDSSSK